MTARTGKPDPSEYHQAFAGYVGRVPADGDVLEVLAQNGATLRNLLSKVTDTTADFRYAEGKWTVRQLLRHVIDGERVFFYRALAIARGDEQSLPAFDENTY